MIGKLMIRDPLSLTFSALADPTRRAVLARLTMGQTSVKELAEPFSLTAPTITKHLKVLERAGLIERSRNAQLRPCQLTAAPLKEISVWIETYRAHWDHSMQRLDTYLAQMK
jgi:DNA-binding transcriptional ArsR family regulator